MERKGATLEELLPLITGEKQKVAYANGDVNNAVMTVGQVVGLIHDVPSISEIIENIVSEARFIGKRLQTLGISD